MANIIDKMCKECIGTMPLSDFSRDKTRKDGFKRICKSCSSAYAKRYYQKNKQRIDAKNKEYLKDPINKKRFFEYRKKWVSENKDRVHASNKKSYLNNFEKNRDVTKNRRKKYELANPEKSKARMVVKSAIRNGSLKRLPCEICGEIKSQAHHWSYLPKHWLDVKWLCHQHHADEHIRLKSELSNNLGVE